ncbi:hypothetical protein [Oricola thermophila]|uniref:Uncharacterized protein n=1 Tax=Oricola thermophila TaxID=2742145 RepID=A0A6N1VFV4_9HYPH|nr:hypothetical protein [Oricola thermophila]QKV19443.1 hypothetical protein HTY61_13740 [Oricola thermophila]
MIDARDVRYELLQLRRRAWEALLDLGLSEAEIAAYYGIAGDGADERPDAAGRDSVHSGVSAR